MKTPNPFARIAAAAALSVLAMAASAQTTLRFGHANNAGEVAVDAAR